MNNPVGAGLVPAQPPKLPAQSQKSPPKLPNVLKLSNSFKTPNAFIPKGTHEGSPYVNDIKNIIGLFGCMDMVAVGAGLVPAQTPRR